jgi:predicted lipoprotein with Yx(FWY)xxD motif
MRRTLTVVAAFVLLFAACGGDEEEPAAGGGQEEPQEEAAATIEVASASMGDILADADGNTLYMFVPDQEENGEPTCYEDCAEAWPAFEATGELTAGEGLDQSLLGTAERTDGTTQVTYNDLPLYYFSGDEAAGDTNGQGLMDIWYVMSPEGEPVGQT